MAAKEVLNRYIAVAIDAQHYPAEGEKAPSIGVRCRVIDGPDAGRELIWYGNLKEGKAQEITAKALRIMGWSDNDIVGLGGLGSTKFVLTEYVDEYEGKRQVRTGVWPFEKKSSLREEDRATFAAQFKALAASVPAVKVTDDNRAPAELPPPRQMAGGNGASEAKTAPDGLPF